MTEKKSLYDFSIQTSMASVSRIVAHYLARNSLPKKCQNNCEKWEIFFSFAYLSTVLLVLFIWRISKKKNMKNNIPKWTWEFSSCENYGSLKKGFHTISILV